MSHGADSIKSILYALAANGAIAVAKFAAAILTGSGSMMAESIHSAADCGNQALLLYGLKQAKQPPSPEHPLGHGKAVYFWSFIVALMLFSMGGFFSIYEGVHKLSSHEPMERAYIAILVLVFSILAEGGSLWGCVKEVNKERGSMSYREWFKETRKSELLVVFGEDLAALIGLTFALVAVTLAAVTGNPLYDALGSIIIGVLLVVIAFFVGVEVKALLVGQGVGAMRRAEMLEYLNGRAEIGTVLNLLTLQMGSDVMVAIKAEMAPTDSSNVMVDAINTVEAGFKERFPDTLWLFFEPDHSD